jgi:hypothetical protein
LLCSIADLRPPVQETHAFCETRVGLPHRDSGRQGVEPTTKRKGWQANPALREFDSGDIVLYLFLLLRPDFQWFASQCLELCLAMPHILETA